MGREKTDYRAQMERLNELYPDKEMLNINETMQIYGCKDYRTIAKIVPFKNRMVSKVTLARIMCG